MPVLPARLVPMPPQVGRVVGDDDEVPDAGLDDVVAPGADVLLHRLVGLHDRHLDVGLLTYLGIRAHANRTATTTKAAASIR